MKRIGSAEEKKKGVKFVVDKDDGAKECQVDG